MTTLFPPILENQRQSIWHLGPELAASEGFFFINFQMPIINDQSSDIQHIQISIKYKNTNRPALMTSCMPDGGSIFYSLGRKSTEQIGLPASDTDKETGTWFYDADTGIGSIKFPYTYFDGGYPKNGCEYTIQLRFGANRLWDEMTSTLRGFHVSNYNGFSAWFNAATTAVPSPFGEWSNIQKVFCIEQATTVTNVEVKKTFVPEVSWSYDPPVIDGKVVDAIEQVILQWDYEIEDGLGQKVRQFRTQTFNGAYNSSGTYSFTQQLPIAPVVPIHISMTAITQHNTQYVNNAFVYPLGKNKGDAIADFSDRCKFSEFQLKNAQIDDGCIAKQISFELPRDEKGEIRKDVPYEGAKSDGDTLMMFRYDLKTLDCVLIKSLEIITRKRDENGNKLDGIDAYYTVKDYTVAMGEEYQYVPVIQSKELDGRIGLCEKEWLEKTGIGSIGYGRLMEMEVTFLNDRYHQLRIHGNLNVTNFKRNTSDQFQTTLGSKYPYYIRGGAQNYRTLQVSAVISANFDPTFTFLRLEDNHGLVWEDAQSRQLLVNRKDIFGIEEYSRSRWRLGHFHDSVEENPKIGILGYDGYEDWLQLDWSYRNHQTPLVEELRRILADEIADNKVVLTLEGMLKALDNKGKNLLSTEGEKHRKAIEDILKEMEKSYVNRRVKIQGEYAAYDNKTIYSPYYMKNDLVNIDTSHSSEMIYLERKFRDAVMSWLSDGKPKLYRSETEGNMIVMISAPSFTPLNKTQRMVYTVSMTLTEIADYTLQNLIEYNLVPSEIISEYVAKEEWDFSFGNPDPWVATHVGLFYRSRYDIPQTMIALDRSKTEFSDIDIYDALVCAYHPDFYWEASGLPAGVYLISESGKAVIKGDPNKFEVTPKGIALITVWDNWDYEEMEQARKTMNDKDFEEWLTEYKKEKNSDGSDKHDSASMVINVGEFFSDFEIMWTDKEGGDAKIGNPKIQVLAVGEEIPKLYFKVRSDAPGVAPYDWYLGNGNIPFGILTEKRNRNNSECVLSGTFSQAISQDGTFDIECVDAKSQHRKITIEYQSVHTPVYLAPLQETSTITGWEEGYGITPIDYFPQVYYGKRNEFGNGNFAFELLFYKNDQIVRGTENSYIPGIEITKEGVLKGTPAGADSYPYMPTQPVIIRVYDLNDEVTDHNQPNVAEYTNNKWCRYSQIEVTIDVILRKFEFIKPEDIDVVKREPGQDPMLVGMMINLYDIQSVLVDEDGKLLPNGASDEEKKKYEPPVRGGLAISASQPYRFVARAPMNSGILGNYSVSDYGRFTGTMMQTAPEGIMEIVAIDGRGHEVSIEVEIPRTDGKFYIAPNPPEKFTIKATEIGQSVAYPDEWFRVDSHQPDIDGTMDDLKGEQGDFKNFQISVEGIPAGIYIEQVTTDPDGKTGYFVFKGKPVGNVTGFQDMATLKANATYLQTIDWHRYSTETNYRRQVDQQLEAKGITLGVGTHFGSMKITDDFKIKNPDGTFTSKARTATYTILVAGVYAPFTWISEAGKNYSIPQTYLDSCVSIAPLTLPKISGGMAPFHWTEESLAELEPYSVVPSSNGGELTGGFDRDVTIQIVGSPTKVQEAKTVNLTLVDANGCERSIPIQIGKITTPVKIQAAEQWVESFIRNHSNASRGQIRVAEPQFDGTVVFKYNGQVNAILPNGMTLDANGYLQGVATTLTGQVDIGSNITIEVTDGTETTVYNCPRFILPATIEPPKPAFAGEYVINNLIYNMTFTSPPLFSFPGANGLITKIALDNTNNKPVESIKANNLTFILDGVVTEQTDADKVCKYNLQVTTSKTGINGNVTPIYMVSQVVRFKPVPMPFSLSSPSSDFYIPGLTVGQAMTQISLTKGLVHGGTKPIASWEVRVLRADGTKEAYGLEHYGLQTKFGDTDKTELILFGTPTQKSYTPITFSVKATDATGQVSQEIQFTIPGIYDALRCTSAPITIAGGRVGNTTDIVYILNTTGGSGNPMNYNYSDPDGILTDYSCELSTALVGGVTQWRILATGYSTADMNNKNGKTGRILLRDTVSKQEVNITINLAAIMDAKPGLTLTKYDMAAGRGTTRTVDLSQYIVAEDKSTLKFEVALATPLGVDWEWRTASADGLRTDQTGDKRTLYNKTTLYIKNPNVKSRYSDNKMPFVPAKSITLELKSTVNTSDPPYQTFTVNLPQLPAVN